MRVLSITHEPGPTGGGGLFEEQVQERGLPGRPTDLDASLVFSVWWPGSDGAATAHAAPGDDAPFERASDLGRARATLAGHCARRWIRDRQRLGAQRSTIACQGKPVLG